MDIISAAGLTGRTLVLTGRTLVLVAAGLAVAACGSGSASPGPQQQSASPSAASAATERPPAGDIPDTTVYVPFRPAGGRYEIKVPEGWARTVSPSAVEFTDKLNRIAITVVKGAAPTIASARAGEVPKIAAAAGFRLAGVTSVTRAAGSAVLIRYLTDSRPDPVTAKVYTDVVERYEFFRHGMKAIVSLSGPRGADNVDPWLTVTNSFRWLG